MFLFKQVNYVSRHLSCNTLLVAQHSFRMVNEFVFLGVRCTHIIMVNLFVSMSFIFVFIIYD